jgi:hypothetical protein
MRKIYFLLIFFIISNDFSAQALKNLKDTEIFPLSKNVVSKENKKQLKNEKLHGYFSTEMRPEIPVLRKSDGVQSPDLSNAPQATVFSLPFRENFTELYSNRWSIVDANGDRSTWWQSTGSALGGGRNGGGIMIYSSENTNQGGDDYLLTRFPVALSAGSNYLKLWYRTLVYHDNSWGDTSESFEIYFGTSELLEELEWVGGKTELRNTDWEPFTVLLPTLAEPGEYYFAIKATSPVWHYALIITDVEIDDKELTPDLTISSIIRPISGCVASSEEKIGFSVKNIGEVAASSFSITCFVDGEEVTQTFNTSIDPHDVKTVYLTQQFNFTVPKTYPIDAQVEIDNDMDESNNSASTTFVASSPFELPINNSLLNEEDAAFYHMGEPDSWRYDSGFLNYTDYGGYRAYKENVPLYTSCLDLAAGSFILIFKYWGGEHIYTDDLEVRIGKSGTDVTDWRVIASITEIEETTSFKSYETAFEIEEAGAYRVAFIPTKFNFMVLGTFELFPAPERDIAVVDISSDPKLPISVPYTQLKDEIVNYSVTLLNKGSQVESFTLDLLQNGNKIDSKPVSLNVGERKDIIFPKKLDLQPIQLLTLTASVEIDDQRTDNNSKSLSINIGNTFAMENAAEPGPYSVSLAGENYQIGNVFTLIKEDKLTSMTILFSENPEIENEEMKIGVYPMDYDIYPDDGGFFYFLGEPIYIQRVYRPLGGFQTWTLPTTTLEPGKYFFSIITLSDYVSLDLAYINPDDEEGVLYLSGDAYMEDKLWIYLERFEGQGFIPIRANFAPYTGLDPIKNVDIRTYVSKNLFSVNTNQLINKMTVFDIKGSLVYQSEDRLNKYDHTINTSNWAKGMYIVRINTALGVKSEKFIVK